MVSFNHSFIALKWIFIEEKLGLFPVSDIDRGKAPYNSDLPNSHWYNMIVTTTGLFTSTHATSVPVSNKKEKQ